MVPVLSERMTLSEPAVSNDAKDGVHLRHRVSPVTGKYKGEQILNASESEKVSNKKTETKTEEPKESEESKKEDSKTEEKK